MTNADDKVVREVAEADFERFGEMMDLDFDVDSMDDEDAKSFGREKERIIRAICIGSLTITDAGEPVFTPQRSGGKEPITFYEPTGATLMAMDRKKKSEDIGKMYATMADMTRKNIKTFSTMKMSDLKVCMAVALLFLG